MGFGYALPIGQNLSWTGDIYRPQGLATETAFQLQPYHFEVDIQVAAGAMTLTLAPPALVAHRIIYIRAVGAGGDTTITDPSGSVSIGNLTADNDYVLLYSTGNRYVILAEVST